MESRPDPIQVSEAAASVIAEPDVDGREHADFLHLLDATAAEREAWLAEAAARCESYARRLRTLLAEVEGDLGRIEEERRDPDLGRRIGRWRLTRSLGRGATARVSLGVDEGVAEGHPDRRAAIKLFDRVDFGAGFRKRLEREIEALRRIDHPGVVRFLGNGTDEATGRPFVAMEFVDGAMPIVEWASVRAATVDERAELVRQLREALSAAHAAGVVHRDLSPGNVLVDRDGRVKIVDFGIAAVVRESIGRAGSVSASGFLLGGTPATMAPEQVEPSLGPIGPWTDEYAAAVIAFRLFAGRFPYDTSGSLASVAQAVVHVPAPEIHSLEPGTPAGLAAWIDASLVKRVDARRAAMGAPTLGRRRNGGHGSRRVRTLAVGAAVFLAAIAAWAFDSVRARGPAPPGPKIEEQESEMNISKAMSGAAAAWALASGVAAVDRDVPGEYPTIQAAVDASTDGDMVRVAPGTYAPFDMGDKLIVVESTGGAAVTTIDAAGLPTSAVKFGPNSTFASTLRGFTIRTGSGTILPDGVWRAGGGCYLISGTGAAATIEDCVFVGATGGCGYGTGIMARKANLAVRRCRFIGLSAFHGGPAIQVEPVPTLSVPGEPTLHSLFEDSSIEGTSSYNNGGILCLLHDSTALTNVRIARCDFVGNSASYQGGALIVDGAQTSEGGEVIVDRCVFRNNNASLANSIGLALFDGNQDFRLTLRGSVFADPSVSVRRARGQISLENTRFCAGPSAVAGSYDNLGGNVWSCPPAADCDGDGMDDLYQVTLGLAADLNANGIPDACEPAPCPGDTNDSGVVNAVDISVILSAWGTDGGKFPGADTNEDGTVDGSDLAEVLAGWGPCP